jgi:hypothetical protein
VVDPRLLRRVIKSHRDLPGLSLSVPHSRCYALDRAALLSIVDAVEVGLPSDKMPPGVILVARPSSGDIAKRSESEILTKLWRAAFHASVHLAMEARVLGGGLDEPDIRERIDHIGQTEFDEIRAILRHDDLLLPPHDDREAYTEFVALYLELRYFAAPLLAITFPGLPPREQVDQILAEDVDARRLLENSCPDGIDPFPILDRVSADGSRATSAPPPSVAPSGPRRRAPGKSSAERLVRIAEGARDKREIVRAALLDARASMVDDSELASEASAATRGDVETLVARLDAALRPRGEEPSPREDTEDWLSLLTNLAGEAAARPGLVAGVEAKFLHDLERACLEAEEDDYAVDVVTWALSRGKRPIVRPLPATRELRVARQIAVAAKKVWHLRMPSAQRRLLARLLRSATERAEQNVRAVLRPRILGVLETVGLHPETAPERVARGKLVEELLDHAVTKNFIHLAHLRDALSKNQLKLEDLASTRQLVNGDPLLHADALLDVELDGVYRRGEIYLRALQKFSSVAFGTRPGRFATLYVLLPFGGAFVLLEGIGHLILPVMRALSLGEIQVLTQRSFWATSAAVFGLLHSELLRRIAMRILGWIGRVLAFVFLRAPRWVLTRPTIRRILRSRPVRVIMRRVLVPASLTAGIIWLSPLGRQPMWISAPAAVVIFGLASYLLALRAALVVEDIVLDWLGPTWRTLSGQVLPGLFRMIAGLFRFLLDLLELAFSRVDAFLRARKDHLRVTLVAKATAGAVWFFVAYMVRLYTTLLVEPEINPLKHFPVVTVAHKLLLPVSPELLAAFSAALSPLGSVVGGTIAATTVFLLPSVFGFLVWELKENRNLYRASRKRTLDATRLGQHGETMSQLMVPGFHSGTLPKLYDRLRREVQREEALALVAADGRVAIDEARPEGALGRFRDGMQSVEQALTRFAQRELVALLAEASRWQHGPLQVAGVQVGSNRVRIRLGCRALGEGLCEIGFEEQSGFLVASIPELGFLAALANSESRVLFENALAGFYHYAGVDMVREQIESVLGQTHYDVADEGLVVWPDDEYETEIVYRIHERVPSGGRAIIEPRVTGTPPATPPKPLDERAILYRHQAIAWADWQRAWEAANQPSGEIPRLMEGASLIPET